MNHDGSKGSTSRYYLLKLPDQIDRYLTIYWFGFTDTICYDYWIQMSQNHGKAVQFAVIRYFSERRKSSVVIWDKCIVRKREDRSFVVMEGMAFALLYLWRVLAIRITKHMWRKITSSWKSVSLNFKNLCLVWTMSLTARQGSGLGWRHVGMIGSKMAKLLGSGAGVGGGVRRTNFNFLLTISLQVHDQG